MIKYPVRCRIIDVEGTEVFPGIIGATPEISKPHVGKTGWAVKVLYKNSPNDGYHIHLLLDDGNTLWGYECWWEPIK